MPVAGLIRLPGYTFPDPSSRVLDERTMPRHAGRTCSQCEKGRIGEGSGDQPGLLTGFCPNCGAPYSLKPRLKPGDVLADQYRVVGPLKCGGLGWVYLARDLHLDGNYVALKGVINKSRREVDIAIAERRFLTTIDHPNFVRIFNFVRHEDGESGEQTGYIVMEYLNGETLEEICDRAAASGEPMRLEHVLGYGHEILAALGYLHERGLLYTDMKPSNVICTQDRIKLIDVASVRHLVDPDAPVLVTTGFHDPAEALPLRLSVGSDLYAVGKTLQKLFRRSRADRDAGIEPAVESFRRLVNRAILDAKKRDGRFRSAADMSEQVTGVLREALALRRRRECPERSALFAPTPALLDAGLGTAPPLEDWIAPGAGAAEVHSGVSLPRRPAPQQVATGLPIPLADPEDPNAELLATMTAPDARALLSQIAAIRPDSIEVRLLRYRAHLELSELDNARACLDGGPQQAGTAAHHAWRMAWHRGLLALARENIPAATREFEAVYDALPGEVAPKLALGVCAELSGQTDKAKEHYEVVWQRDRSYASAAFGLVRFHLTAGERGRARATLDEIPRVSPHFRAARTAAVLACVNRLGTAPETAPSAADLDEAVSRLSKGEDGGSPGAGEAGERLTAAVRRAALVWSLANPGTRLRGNRAVLGDPVTEHSLRTGLEQSYRALARQARSADEHGTLVDLANTFRPETLL